jgi:signal transduction histidine kinase
MKDNLRGSVPEVRPNVASQTDVLRELDRLRVEVEALRASGRELVLGADDDRRRIERDLHDGVHQQFVALAVDLQLLDQALGSDPVAAARLVEELRRDVQRGLDETVLLAQRIYPAALGVGDLAALLRSAAVDAGVQAAVELAAGTDYPREVVMTVYLCWLAALAGARGDARVTIRIREEDDVLRFDITGGAHSDADLEGMRRRVDALGGQLVFDGGSQASGSLPLSR